MTDHITKALIDAGKRRSAIAESVGAVVEWSVWEAGLRLRVEYAGQSTTRTVDYLTLGQHRMPTLLLSQTETSALQDVLRRNEDQAQ